MTAMTTAVNPNHELIPEWTLGEKLRKIRRGKKMNQAEFAEALQVPQTTLAGWETDKTKMRDQVAIARRVKMLTGVPMWWFLGTEPPRGPEDPDGSRLGESNPRPFHYE